MSGFLKPDPYMANRVKIGQPYLENGVVVQRVSEEKENPKASSWTKKHEKASARRLKQK